MPSWIENISIIKRYKPAWGHCSGWFKTSLAPDHWGSVISASRKQTHSRSLFTPLLSGKRCRSIHCQTIRLLNDIRCLQLAFHCATNKWTSNWLTFNLWMKGRQQLRRERKEAAYCKKDFTKASLHVQSAKHNNSHHICTWIVTRRTCYRAIRRSLGRGCLLIAAVLEHWRYK